MRRFVRTAFFGLFIGSLAVTLGGCASTRLNKGASEKPLKPAERIAQLEREAQTKDQAIAQMQQELNTLRDRETASYDLPSSYGSGRSASDGAAKVLRVPGVSVEELQNALKVAGYNPGPVDGRLGAKTKDAIKRFQRKHGLKADGIVGQKTWSVLKRRTGSSGY